jgi:site-specific DNA-methyltransferase (adenine-specific)
MSIQNLELGKSSFTANGVELRFQDAILGMRELEENSIDIAVADPPYGAFTKTPSTLQAGHNLEGFGGAWKAANHTWDKIDPRQHLDMAIEWLSELKRVVSPSGSIWIHASYHNSGFMNVACQLLGLEIINEVVWFKRNAFPNLSGTRLTASHETILWVHTGGKKRSYNFNYDKIKSLAYPEDPIKSEGKQMRTVWDIPNNKTSAELELGKHPTQKPERLIQRLLDISAPESGTLLSPFAGSGTDLVIAMRNGLKAIGFEVEPEFYDLASRRISNEQESLLSGLDFGKVRG